MAEGKEGPIFSARETINVDKLVYELSVQKDPALQQGRFN
jgi:hypothetical protein